ncbi:unnamed protein product [Dracunculus medinensis]|uniref:RING-type domain-containing protein n=1 Tax=Dracunculus medinensis TaxID=318479 RepID=A0A0N4UAR5_DRAME|nr:unnamed protein product [Dracunculus medinensis]
MCSTLIEIININLEDFSESFLTCATCLLTYDQDKRKAKTLPCSHSVCLECLENMQRLSQQIPETGVLRCPLCRELAVIPADGVSSFPSSFLINQLLDLMQKQRRDVVPNCSVHQQEQLLYCELCDLVFCFLCDNPLTRSCADHTVVPFSIAIKRMSEIVVFKAKQCIANLNIAAANVDCETKQLDRNVDHIVDDLNSSFQEISQLVENRRRELIDSVRIMRDEKRKVLRDQMELIDSHRKRLERELGNCQIDVRDMGSRTKRVAAATEEALNLLEPRENAFLKLHTETNKLLHEMEKSLSQFGTISGSTTFPGQCSLHETDTSSVHTETRLLLTTCDVNGKFRTNGGDPVKAEVVKKRDKEDMVSSESHAIGATIIDNDDGTYIITFKPNEPGQYSVAVSIFGRPVKNSPFTISVSHHHSPRWQFGCQGSGPLQLNQPVKIAQDCKGYMYILDTGNNRIKILDGSGQYIDDITGESLSGGSTVGLSLLPGGDILTLNWRTKSISKCNSVGDLIQSMSFSEFIEPIDICVDSHGRLFIADTSCGKVFVFDSQFRPLFSFNVFVHVNSPVTCICIGLNDDVLVGTCSSLLVFDGGGRFVREILLSSTPTQGRFMTAACAVCPATGNVIAAVVDSKKNRANLGSFLFSMDSHGSRLRRPCGICVGATSKWEKMCFVVDSATHSVKAFCFK